MNSGWSGWIVTGKLHHPALRWPIFYINHPGYPTKKMKKMQNYIIFYIHFNSIKLFHTLNRKALAWDQAFWPPRPLTFIEVTWGLYLLYAVIQWSKYDVPVLQMGLWRLKGFNMTWSIRPIVDQGFKSSQSDCKTHYFPTIEFSLPISLIKAELGAGFFNGSHSSSTGIPGY